MTVGNTENSATSTDGRRGLAAVILAAGRSTRMKTDHPKVLHEVCGQSMLSHVLCACRKAGIHRFHIVVGFGKQAIIPAFDGEEGVSFVEQREQKGTGHAVSMCAEELKDFTGDVVVLAGDMPMVRSETLQGLIQGHRAACSAASLATTVLDDPSSYGRIIRNANGDFDRIVEHRDCTVDQLRIREVNPSYYCFDAQTLFEALPKIKPDNAKGEFYITDVLEIIRKEGKAVRASTSVPAVDAVGINSRADLAEVSRLMQQRIQADWMEAGVTLDDPATTWIDSRAAIGPESRIKPFSFIEGRARIGARCVVGPYAYIGDGAVVEDGTTIGSGALSAFDATAATQKTFSPIHQRGASVTRQPPSQAACAPRSQSC
jgi:bifunctional UDP-N-acetylglucosamine pyrophosphorylase/glucosamine-1-phosphate N-acetyltransferase